MLEVYSFSLHQSIIEILQIEIVLKPLTATTKLNTSQTSSGGISTSSICNNSF